MIKHCHLSICLIIQATIFVTPALNINLLIYIIYVYIHIYVFICIRNTKIIVHNIIKNK